MNMQDLENASSLPGVKNSTFDAALIIRFIGLAVMLSGLITAYQVVSKAWLLLEHPENLNSFAEQIEKASHMNSFVGKIDLLLQDLTSHGKRSLPIVMDSNHGTSPRFVQPSASESGEQKAMNASYFAAWGLVLLLLGLIARVSFWAISEGGKLALYTSYQDRQTEKFLKSLVQELRLKQD